MRRCPMLLIIREKQIKTTVRYHLTLDRMAIIKQSRNSKCWRGCRAKGSLLYCWWGCKWVPSLWRTLWRFLKKLKIKLTYDSAAIPLLGIFPKKTIIQKDTYTPIFIAALFTIVRTWKNLISSNRGLDEDVVHKQWNIQFSSLQSLSRVRLFVTP